MTAVSGNTRSALRRGLLRLSTTGRALLPLALLLFAPALHAQFGAQAVGTASSAQSVTVTATATGTVAATVQVLTFGGSGLDFAAATAPTCAGATLATIGSTCTQAVTFTPSVPGLRLGAIVLKDTSGNRLATALIYGTGSGGLGVLTPGNLIPAAGDGIYLGAIADGSAATSAELYLPTSVALDGAGNLYIADSLHHRIRRVSASTGLIATFAGNGNPAYSGDGAAATAASLNSPSGIALDGAGNLYIADTGNNVIRMVDAVTGLISTFAGTGTLGSSGDGAAATAATLNQPLGVTVDRYGNLYIADTGNHRIRRVDTSGSIALIAGVGTINTDGSGTYSGDGALATAAGLNSPYAVAFDAAGNMYIPDSANNRVRKVAAVGGLIVPASSVISTVAGTGLAGYTGDNGLATIAKLYAPCGLAFDAAGNLYIADRQNSAIRKLAPSGTITTLLVDRGGSNYYGGSFNTISLYGPTGLALDGKGNLYLADTLNMIVRKLVGNLVALNYTATPVRQSDKSSPLSQTVENDGNAALDISAITPDANAALDSGTTTCSTGALASNSSCVIGAVFAPSTSGDPLLGNINLGQSGDTANAPLDIELVGDALAVNSTTTSLRSSLNPAPYGQNLTFTATVVTGASTGNLTGTVSFYSGGTAIATAVAVTGAGTTVTASFTSNALPVGLHAITATYSGDSGHFASTSTDNGVAALEQQINESTTVQLVSSVNPASVGQQITFTATVVPVAGGLTPSAGAIDFYDGSTLLAQVASTSGVATYATSTLAAGSHSISAVFEGNTSQQVLGSTSATLVQLVQSASTTQIGSSANPSYYGAPLTLTATVLSPNSTAATGTITFLDGTTLIGTASLSGGVATYRTSRLAVGAHSITAVYGGDGGNGTSTSQVLAETVNKATTLLALAAAPTPGIAGAATTITASISVASGGGTPTGAITFTTGTTTLGSATLNSSGVATIAPVFIPGSYSIVATYAGDANDAGNSSAAFPLTVVQATTQTALAITPTPGVVQSTITFTARVTGNGGTPTGTITFTAGSVTLGTATLNTAGTASVSSTALAAGNYTVTAAYSGDTDDAASNGTAALTVGTIATTTSVGTTITSGSSAQAVLVATVIPASGTTAPTGTVTFTTGSTTIGSASLDASGVASLVPNIAAGNYSIVATYAGDALHTASASAPTSLAIVNTNFQVTLSPATLSLATTQNATVTVNLSSANSFTDSIGLGCASLPAAVTCHFSPNTVTLPANGTATAQLTIDTGYPLTGGTVAARRASTGGMLLAGFGLPASLLLLLVRRRKGWRTLLASFLLLLSAFAATGCSNSFSSASAAPGTYTLQITGTGINSNVIHYGTITLTVTK
jgi:large repetitive protein